ncbi:hypothetical protein GGQ91_002502 [Methylobacterium fujisawaense]|uniref:HTH cro/C1-type domain-containing protein n=1 Tax=Methylobacterium fujisawaense TaxID=107400 RepID=A0ABR6DCQ1_9HYPH|nr:hypothetical protein [Methylobacterium fujisawaense]MBA9063114.1 hypothetical protein [Methylobacterium fujisawaense]
MTTSQKTLSKSDSPETNRLRELGRARAQHIAFDAIYDLWLERQAEGLRKKDICKLVGCDAAWVTRSLAGPGNWTLNTLGTLAEALNGKIEISVKAREKIVPSNYDIYSDLIDGQPFKFCPITDYSPGFKISSEAIGSNTTLTAFQSRPSSGGDVVHVRTITNG